jgi:hypothetical protein
MYVEYIYLVNTSTTCLNKIKQQSKSRILLDPTATPIAIAFDWAIP